MQNQENKTSHTDVNPSKKQYRNIQDFHISELESVDAGSLWNLVGNKLVLVDDDNFVQTNLDLNLFKKV